MANQYSNSLIDHDIEIAAGEVFERPGLILYSWIGKNRMLDSIRCSQPDHIVNNIETPKAFDYRVSPFSLLNAHWDCKRGILEDDSKLKPDHGGVEDLNIHLWIPCGEN